MQNKTGQPKPRRMIWRVLGIMLVAILVIGAVLFYRIRRQLPPELMQDIRAGIAARNIPDADQRFQKYLEGRYGSQTEYTNREKAFLDFFNIDHIRALQLMVKHSPESQRQANIAATAKWVEQYRKSLSPEQRAELTARLQTSDGQNMLRKATAQYNSQDVRYRGQTAAVISQLLTTIAILQKQ